MMPFWKRRPGYAFPIEKVKAARAMVEGNGGSERIDLTMIVAGDRITMELTADQARQLIGDLISAHEAIRPTLRFPRQQW